MAKRVEFHQATINVAIKILDDDQSYGVKQASIVVLLNTIPEWTKVQEQIAVAVKQIEDQVNADGQVCIAENPQ